MPEPLSRLTVLYDSGCPLCSLFREWLAGQPVLVPLDLVPAESAEAHVRFPGLDHARTMQEITVVGDDGSIWTGEHAWVMCLWALASHRALAERLADPGRPEDGPGDGAERGGAAAPARPTTARGRR